MNWVAMVKLGTFYDFHKSGIPSQVFLWDYYVNSFRTAATWNGPEQQFQIFSVSLGNFFLSEIRGNC